LEKYRFPSFRRKPESSKFKQLQTIWTPVFTGVTTFYEFINFGIFSFTSELQNIESSKVGQSFSFALMQG
jgi:hypothetical protein